MLEARHLFKTYTTKKGATTKALDDVSVTFADKGMVFILGKSGSGKSTLLNVCGGLDKMDSGEILIKGKSSNDKSDFDFDSYRNTFVGFVFQEYNILDEFTVEENIALALELQHKKRDKQVIANILADVDMTEYASRKPNTLSGGQKQRVAIARALVKNPEIIMADEPTGALDSNTGKQVFDTLKKLSEKKLVLVVSHDRDFAEQYGDRIIELKDGKIISDMTREENAEADDKNVRFVGTDTVCVKSGDKLTDEDFANIKKFLSKSKGEAVITASRSRVELITRDVRGGEFAATANQPEVRQYSDSEKQMIRSRLPVKHAIKMGASSMKSKPIRLTFTILLSIIAFVLFGTFSTLALYNPTKISANALIESDYSHITVSKSYYQTYNQYENGKLTYTDESYSLTPFTMDEYNEYADKYNGIAAVRADISINNLTLSDNARSFYSSNVNYIVLDNNLELLAGEHATADNEVVISEFIYDAIKSSTFSEININDGSFSFGNNVHVTSYDDVINKYLYINKNGEYTVYTVTGIFKSAAVPSAYSDMKSAADNGNPYTGDNAYDWMGERENGMYMCVAVNKNVFDSLKNSKPSNIDTNQWFETYTYSELKIDNQTTEGDNCGININSITNPDNKEQNKLTMYDIGGNEIVSLSNGQIVISNSCYARYLDYMINYVLSILRNNDFDKYSELYDIYNGYGEYEDNGIADCIMRFSYAHNEQEALNYLETIREFIAEYDLLSEFKDVFLKSRKDYGSDIVTDCAVVGFFVDFTSDGYMYDCAYVSGDVYDSIKYYDMYDYNNWSMEIVTKYQENADAFINAIFVPYDHSRAFTDKLLELTSTRNADDSSATILNSLMQTLEAINYMVSIMSTVFMWIGIVLAVFSLLLMFNFISASIAAKKKEIGILRAIGSRTLDVYKIFLSEALIIALICFVIATAGSFAVCCLINNMMTSMSPMFVTGLLVFGPLSMLCILAITLFTAIVSTVVPVAIYSRKPPVESIRAL